MNSLTNSNNKRWARREFLKLSAAATFGLTISRLPAMAGPFTREDFDKLVPADKKLSPDWVKSLFSRGEPEVLRGSDLKFVGMPVGGIGTGQIYLGGDGRLWHWDLFNHDGYSGSGGPHYANPPIPSSPLEQNFSLTIAGKNHPLDKSGFSNITFRGEYPIGRVEYADDGVPLTVKLEAFSPFIPLNVEDSSLPATIFQFKVQNSSDLPVEAVLSGEMENGICLNNRWQDGILRNITMKEPGLTTLLCSAEKPLSPRPPRADVVFEDWNKQSFSNWNVEGTVFGQGPIPKSRITSYQGEVFENMPQIVFSQHAPQGESPESKVKPIGRLVSQNFIIDRKAIRIGIGGGKSRRNSRFGVTLFLEGQPLRTIAGQDKNEMALEYFDVHEHTGKTAHLEIIDDSTNPWGSLCVGKIVFTDQFGPDTPMAELPDYGTMALALHGQSANQFSPDTTVPFTEKLSGSLGRQLKLAPGTTATVTFVLAWYFPNLTLDKLGRVGRHYETRFSSALAVVKYVSANLERLTRETRLWRDTWYDSTLPFWFLDRTLLNTSILATSTSYRFANGRYYGWEGVGCCAGTCGHVYHYAHAAGRLFPKLERDVRETVDFGLAQQADGAIFFRAEFNNIPAIDGQAGTILRALREHQMSAEADFLQRNWPKIKLATQWLISKDGNGDGLIEGNQHNTLDADWFGPVAWLSGLYLASLSAAAVMADEVGDQAFARQCHNILETGRKNLVTQLFDGAYFINKIDPKHLDAINSGTGCEIDQVFGQSWAFQVGLPRVLPEKETLTALKSLWRYNFSPDVGRYREVNKPGRWYAMPGEAGLLMCTFPRDDWDFQRAAGNKGSMGFAGYFNECMNGFEYQVAGHMIWEGMVLEGLAITRAVHDRYHASRRNPWNEIECGDHYARSMASYGVYLASCGFEYHGPKKHIGFAPKLTPENFKCSFTGAEGWGSFSQRIENGKFTAEIALKSGKLKLQHIALQSDKVSSAKVKLSGRTVQTLLQQEGKKVLLNLVKPIEIHAGEKLEIFLLA